MFFHEKLDCYKRANTVLGTLAKEMAAWPLGYSFLADQLKRAGSSVLLNLAEGNNRRSSKERRRFFNIAQASAAEVSAILDVAVCFNIINIQLQMDTKQELLEITKMIAKL